MSLAFSWAGSLGDFSILARALAHAGLRPRGAARAEEETSESDWDLAFAGKELPLTCRCYQEDGWVAVTLDMEEELFEETGMRHGRERLVQALVLVGIALLQELHLRYVLFDEEIEADIAPEQYRADYLVGITLVADDVPGLNEAYVRPDVQRIERFQGGAVLFRRLDPVPHYRSPLSP